MPASTSPSPSDPLRALFDVAKAGDEGAQRELCVHMRPRLERVAYAILRDHDDAEDVAQLALIRAVTRPALFLGRGSVAGWMTSIAINLARNRIRDARRRREILQGALPVEKNARGAEPAEIPDPERMAVAMELQDDVFTLIQALPPRQRDVVILHAVAQLDFSEIAADLDITELNARVTFWHAKKKLANAMRRTLSGRDR